MALSVRTLILAATSAVILAGPAAAQEQRTLTINTDASDPAPKQAFEELVAAFEAEYPEIDVVVNTFDHEGYKTQIRNFLTAEAPDLANWYAGNRMRPYVEAGLFEPVDDVWEENNLEEQLASAASAMTMNGHKWGVPYTYYQWGLYTRSDVLAEHGIEEIATFDDLIGACETLRAAGLTPIALGSKALWPVAGWFDYLNLRTNGYDFHMQLTSGEIPFTDERVRATFENWQRMLDAECFMENHAAVDWQQTIPNFVNGEAPIMLMGNFAVAPMLEGGLTPEQIEFVQFPVINEEVGMAEDAPTDTMHIPANADNKEDAKTFLAFLARPDVQSQMNATLGQLPINNQSDVPEDKFLAAGFEMLSNTEDLAQFYDRDTRAEMAKAGMEGFQQFLVQPEMLDQILERLEQQRQRIYAAEE
ncbi:extracellular solute-binding protein [Inquilinus sp. CAU 1745]|uniref:ABC transporter substrate-binding protein n=1 Tax=Inquilinus sp. CAU 1745 TaxID=3140369 RepID=UPI00325B48D7